MQSSTWVPAAHLQVSPVSATCCLMAEYWMPSQHWTDGALANASQLTRIFHPTQSFRGQSWVASQKLKFGFDDVMCTGPVKKKIMPQTNLQFLNSTIFSFSTNLYICRTISLHFAKQCIHVSFLSIYFFKLIRFSPPVSLSILAAFLSSSPVVEPACCLSRRCLSTGSSISSVRTCMRVRCCAHFDFWPVSCVSRLSARGSRPESVALQRRTGMRCVLSLGSLVFSYNTLALSLLSHSEFFSLVARLALSSNVVIKSFILFESEDTPSNLALQ